MMLAGGCASGTLSDLSEGAGRAMIAMTTFVLGSLPGLMAQDALNNSAIGQIGISFICRMFLVMWGPWWSQY